MHVRRPDDITAEIQLMEKEILNMIERTCNFQRWQLTRLMYVHIAEVIGTIRRPDWSR